MVSSLLWVDKSNVLNDKSNNNNTILSRLTVLLELYFSQLTLHTVTLDKSNQLDLGKLDYDLILTHEKTIVRWANLAGIDAILWEKLSDLRGKLDVLLQLRRYLEEYPLKLSGWRFKEMIHNGRDAIIFRAVNDAGHTVAIKRFKYVLDQLPSHLIQDFIKNIETQCSLQSTGLVKIYEGGVCDNAFYLVMEYMHHGTLRQSLKSCGVLPMPHAMEWFEEIAESLDCVHQAGLVHRDLKTENIMIREDGSLALSDYGVSKTLLLQTGFITEDEIHCSPYYVSPEQVSGEPCTQASDLYSLGIIFYEILMGCKPYECNQAFELMMSHVMAPTPVFPEALKEYQVVLNGLLAKDYHERFSSGMKAVESLPN